MMGEMMGNRIKNSKCEGVVLIPPLFLWSLGLISIFTLFLLYCPNPFLRFYKQGLLHFPSSINAQNGDEKCDLFEGHWVPDMNGSLYTKSSCLTIPDSKNCQKNGRKDSEYLNWRWKPEQCELPRFDTHKFLTIVGGKKLGFIGDSVARNHMDSLLCLLSQVETPIDVYKDSEDRFRTWHFPASNFTLMILWSKFLIKYEERMVNNSGTGVFNLHLDKVDEKWASKIPGLDYVIISDAHWFSRKNYLYDQDKLIGCVYCNDVNITDFGLNFSIRMSLRSALNFIYDCEECKGMVTFVRTYSPAHFEGGTWNNGGSCNRTRPYGKEEADTDKSTDLELRRQQVEEVERVGKEGNGKGRAFRVLDVTRAMLMRPDGHPGEYWGNKWMKGYNDCVHWCLPGPIDVWNDLLLVALEREAGVFK
uniref:Uncharacterized protein n=2 Tax=Opuntia streptacantha TaxID=393608 RepID=A0A7C9CIL9_OPUST